MRPDIDAIEARHQKATPGPWTLDVETEFVGDGEPDAGISITITEIHRILHDSEWADAEDWERDLANADFITHARTDIPALVARCRELEGRLEFDDRGGAIWFSREDWGMILDGLIGEIAAAEKRQQVNPESTSGGRADDMREIISQINEKNSYLRAKGLLR